MHIPFTQASTTRTNNAQKKWLKEGGKHCITLFTHENFSKASGLGKDSSKPHLFLRVRNLQPCPKGFANLSPDDSLPESI